MQEFAACVEKARSSFEGFGSRVRLCRGSRHVEGAMVPQLLVWSLLLCPLAITREKLSSGYGLTRECRAYSVVRVFGVRMFVREVSNGDK